MPATVLFTLKAEPVPESELPIDAEHFPDSVFRAYVRANFDTDANDSLSDSEREAVSSINVSGKSGSPSPLSDLSGIEHFPNLDELRCGNSELKSLDVSQNLALKSLFCSDNPRLTSLDVSGNPALEELRCSYNELTSLNVSGARALEELHCNSTDLTSLDVSGNPALKSLHCSLTGITFLDVSGNPALEELWCDQIGLTSLDVSGNPALKELLCDHTRLTSLDVSGNPALETLWCSHSELTSLNVSRNPALEYLTCGSTEITSLDVSGSPALKVLSCDNTRITSLDLGRNPALEELRVAETKLSHIDLSQNPALKEIYLQDNIHPVDAEVGGTYDLSLIPGFDLSRVSWEPGTEIEGSLLRFTTETVRYEYDTRLGGEEYKAEFALQAVPGLGNEQPGALESAAAPQPFRAYAEEGVLHVENAQGLIEVFNLQGRRLYAGPESRIPLPSQGVYIVRNQGCSLKVANL